MWKFSIPIPLSYRKIRSFMPGSSVRMSLDRLLPSHFQIWEIVNLIVTFDVNVILNPVPDPDLKIRWRAGGGHPDPWVRVEPVLQNKIFSPFGLPYGLKIRGALGPSPGSATEIFPKSRVSRVGPRGGNVIARGLTCTAACSCHALWLIRWTRKWWSFLKFRLPKLCCLNSFTCNNPGNHGLNLFSYREFHYVACTERN